MACGCNGVSRFSPEYYRRFKAENNNGCCTSSFAARQSCGTESLAEKGSPLWKWEQIYGKLVTIVTYAQDAQGHTIQVVTRTPCGPPEPVRPDKFGCCSVSYRVNR